VQVTGMKAMMRSLSSRVSGWVWKDRANASSDRSTVLFIASLASDLSEH